MSLRILISSSDPKQRAHLVELCESLGGRVFEAASPREALAGARTAVPQLILLADGADSMEPLLQACPQAGLWLCGNHGKRSPRALLEAGATDLLEGAPTREQLECALAREQQRRDLTQEREQFVVELDDLRGTELIGRSRPILRVHDQVQRIASTPRTTVLVTGEAGTGKETVARSIHRSSARARHPFVAVACGLPDEVLLETLFYGRGSTSPNQPAATQSPCALAQAEGGTLFLDQIDGASLEIQARLLELLQDRTWRTQRDEECGADVRVVASTREDLARLVAEGRFREDLLYRLNVLSVDVPPLRERGQDVVLLAEYFLARIGRQMGKSDHSLAPEVLSALEAHDWYGNVRELRNALERGLICAQGCVITCSDLGLQAGLGSAATPGPGEDFRIRHMEEILIRRALHSAGGNRSQTARLLGVNRTTLYNKLRTYQIGK